MHMGGFAVVMGVLVAAAAALTRPDLDDFDLMIESTVQQKVASAEVGASDDAFSTIALVGCKLRPGDCVDLIRQSLDVTMTDYRLFSRFEVKGMRRETTCTGVFTRIVCRRPIFAE